MKLLREKEVPELDRLNSDMQKYYELIPGGIQAPLAIHNVGGNPAFSRLDEVIERVIIHRILTGIAVMVIVPRLHRNTLSC